MACLLLLLLVVIEWKDGRRIKHPRSGRPSRIPSQYQGTSVITYLHLLWTPCLHQLYFFLSFFLTESYICYSFVLPIRNTSQFQNCCLKMMIDSHLIFSFKLYYPCLSNVDYFLHSQSLSWKVRDRTQCSNIKNRVRCLRLKCFLRCSFSGHFSWDKYLKETGATAAPAHCFKQVSVLASQY